MGREKMIVGLSAENPIGNGYFYAELGLPATSQQIMDVKQRARFTGTSGFHDVEILSSPYIGSLEYMRMDTTSVEELNYLAQRINEMPDDEIVIFQALLQKRYADISELDELVSVKDLINMTYGLDEVMIASGVSNDEELDQFVIDNDLNTDISEMPDDVLYLLDRRRIGELQRENDGGVFIGNKYVE